MNQAYKKVQEKRMKAVFARMPPEQLKELQLAKLFKLANMIHQTRFKDLVANLLLGRARTFTNSAVQQKRMQDARSIDMLEIRDKQVDMFFHHWGSELNELPKSYQRDIIKLSRPKTYGLHEKVIKFEETQQNMYLVVEGNAILFQNPYSYQKFQKQVELLGAHEKEKATLVSRPNFSNLVHVGTIILKHVRQDPLIKLIINKGRRRLEAKHIEDRIYQGEVGFTKLSPGSTFGDFEEAKGRVYKSQCVVAMSETLKCIMIQNRDIRALFSKILTPENINLVRGRISTEVLSQNVIKKLSRCFNERNYPIGAVFVQEDQPLNSIYVIKSGTCEVFSKQHPLKKPVKDRGAYFLKLPVSGEEMCFGLDQGSMSSAFNYYPISKIGPGAWIGEESLLSDTGNELCYSIRCETQVRLLEISIVDFEEKMPSEMIEELQGIALQKQILKLVRMKEIAATATDLKEREEMHKFHDESLRALIRMHPHASKRIMRKLGHQQQLEGQVRTARQKGAVNIGEIRVADSTVEVSKPSQSKLQEDSQNHDPRQPHEHHPQEPLSPASPGRRNSQPFDDPTRVYIETQTNVQAISASGKPLSQEPLARRVLLERKLEALEKAAQHKWPKRIHEITETAKPHESPTAPEDLKASLNPSSKRTLLASGVQDNTPQMLSLTTVNGVPIEQGAARSQANGGRNAEADDDILMYEPTESQLREIHEILGQRKKNPILQMREQARQSKQKHHKSSSVPPRQVVRSITFFNTQQAEHDRQIELNEQRQVFKLPESNRQAAGHHQDKSQGPFRDSKRIQQCSSFKLDSSYAGASMKMLRGQNANPFLQSGIHTSISALGSQAGHPRYASQQFRTMMSSAVLHGKGHKSPLAPIRDRAMLPQSFLYHAKKVSSKDIENLHEIKHVQRQELNKSLQFTSGGLSIEHTMGEPVNRLMNVNSSTLGLEPPSEALFDDKRENENLSSVVPSRSRLMNANENESSRSRVPRSDKKKSVQSQRDSEAMSVVFKLDFNDLSAYQHIQRSESHMVNQTADERDVQRRAFEFEAAQERAHSKLELEMLKDLKAVDPDNEDPRLRLVTNESRGMIVKMPKERADMRFLEKKITNTASSILAVDGGDSSGVAHQIMTVDQTVGTDGLKTDITGRTDDDQLQAFEEYLEISQKNEEEEREKSDLQSSQPQSASDGGILVVQKAIASSVTAESSASHNSVLGAIDRTVQLYSPQGFAGENNEEVRNAGKSTTAANVSVLQEMLTNRNKNAASGPARNGVKVFKTGTHKVTNLINIDSGRNRNSQIEPRDLSPRGALKYQSLRSSNQTQAELGLSLFAQHLRNSAVAQSNISGYDAEAYRKISASVDLQNRGDGLQIMQMDIDSKKGQKPTVNRKESSKQRYGSNSMTESVRSSVAQVQRAPPSKSRSIAQSLELSSQQSRYQKPNIKLATLATKSKGGASSNRNVAISVRKSYQSSQEQVQSKDLDVVMDNQETNFKKKKRMFGVDRDPFSVKQSSEGIIQSSSPSVKVQRVRIELEKMRNTHQEDTDRSHALPRLVYQDDGLLGGSAQFEVSFYRDHGFEPPSSGTKYKQTATDRNAGGQFLNSSGDDASAALMGITFSKDGNERMHESSVIPICGNSSKHEDEKATEKMIILPPVNGEKRSTATFSLLEKGHEEVQTRRQDVVESDAEEPSQLANTDDAKLDTGKFAEVNNIKVAIGKNKKSPSRDKIKDDSPANRYLQKKVAKLKEKNQQKRQSRRKQNEGSPRSPVRSGEQQPQKEKQRRTRRRNQDQYETMEPAQSKRQPRERKERKGRGDLNDDLNKESVLAHYQSENFRHVDPLRSSEMSSINSNTNWRVQSLVSDRFLERFEHLNVSQPEANRTELANYLPEDSPDARFKHMPASLYKHKRLNQGPKVPKETYFGSPDIPRAAERFAQLSPKSSIFAAQSSVQNELSDTKNQRMSRDGKKLLQSGKAESVLGRSSALRRSLIMQNSQNPSEFFDEPNKLPRQDSVVLPGSYSRVLQRSSQPGFDHVSAHSVNSQKLNSPSLLRASEDDFNSQLRRENVENQHSAAKNAAEQTRKRFQQIKEEKRRMQQM